MLVAVVGSGLNRDYHVMLEQMGHKTLPIRKVSDVREALEHPLDVVLFVGGADVNPELYGHTVHPTTGISMQEDELYEQAFCQAREYDNIKFVGICRGSQFLCAMAGGTLVQDCDSHAVFNGHEVSTKWNKKYHVTSTHHQMQHPVGTNHEVIAWAHRCDKKYFHVNGKEVDLLGGRHAGQYDYEVVWYKDIKALAFQPHPEFYGAGETLDLFKRCWEDYM